MKKTLLILAVIVISLMFSCKPEPDNNTTGVFKVTTSSVSNITETSAKCGGIVTATGYAVGSCGLCYSETPNPTIDSYITSDLVGTGSFTSTMSGLEPGTKYYVRAYATTDSEIFYGEQKEFTTLGDDNGGDDDNDDNGGGNGGDDEDMRKIKRIYRSDGMFEEIWSWNNDKLHTIDYYFGGDYDGTSTYSYNSNGQLTRIDCNIYGNYYYYECEYKNNKLSKILGHRDDSEEEYTFKYNGSKISEIEATYFEYDKKAKSHSKEKYINPLKLLLPERVCQSLNKRRSRSSSFVSYDEITEIIKLRWDGDNISELELMCNGYDEEYFQEQEVCVYKYDNKINPFYNHLEIYDGVYSYFYENISKNNIKYKQYTVIDSWSEDGVTWESDTWEGDYSYEYTYDGEYPISYRTHEGNYESPTITYFEYE